MAGGQELKAVLSLAGKIDPSLQKAMKQAAKEAAALNKEGSGIGKAFATAGKVAGKSLAAIGTAAAVAATAVGAVAMNIAKESIAVGMSFEAGMSQVAATMGTTVDQIEVLSDKAKEMGATTKFTATEAAEAMNYMALAGWDVQQQMQGIEPILSAAAAGGLELGYASDLITDSMSALGLSFEELPGFVDQISKASQKANANIAQLGEGILTVGGTAKSLAGGTVELNTVLGLLADNGIKGSEGGTALRNTILSLSAPTDAAAKELKRLGVQVSDAEGNMRPLQDIIGELGTAMDGMGNVARADILNTIFNKRDIKSVEALLGTTTERWNGLTSEIENSAGSAGQQASTLLDNLQGDITLFQSAMEGAGIEIYEAMQPALRSLVQSGSSFIESFRESGQLDQLAETFGRVLDAVAELAAGSLPGILELLGELLASLGGTLADILPDLLGMGGSVLPVLMDAFQELTPPIMSIVRTALPILSRLVSQLAPIFGQLLTQLAPVVAMLLELAMSVLAPLLPMLGELLGSILPPLIAIVSAVFSAIAPFIPMLMQLVMAVIQPLLPMLAMLVQALLPPLMTLLDVIFNQVIMPLMPVLMQLIQAFMPVALALLQGILPILQALAPVIAVIGEVLGIIVQIIGKIIEIVAGGIGKVVDFFTGIFGGAKEATQATNELGDSMNSLPAGGGEFTMPEVVIPEIDTTAFEVDIPPIDTTAYTGSIDSATSYAMTQVPEIGDAFADVTQTAATEAGKLSDTAGQALQQLSQTGIAAMKELQAGTQAAFTSMQSGIDSVISSLSRMIAALKNAASQASQINISVGGGSAKMAYGGILTATPGGIPVTAAEAGYDEAFIPINRTPRSIGLLAETAARMGFNLFGGNTTGNVSYNPTVVIQGSASEDDVRSALAADREEFFALMDEYLAERGRTSFEFEFAEAY